MILSAIWKEGASYKNKAVGNRYLPLSTIEMELQKLPVCFNLRTEGFSVSKKPVRSVSFGKGKTKVLLWSQMHGNETTTTKAVFDLLKFFENPEKHALAQEILSACTLKIIPVLNPDGAEAYTRENINKVDLNRDAQHLSQPESRVLHKVFEDFKPNFCFNLHDQRTIYSAGKSQKSAVLSFLSPSMDVEKTVNTTRKVSMHHIVAVNDSLQQFVPRHIGRYDDAFNPHCVGDKFQSLGVPTILFEAGHFPNDYQREHTRSLAFMSLLAALRSISKKPYDQNGFHRYALIPENQKLFFDVLIRNVLLDGKNCDIGIRFREKLKNQQVEFVPFLSEISDLQGFYGHKEIKGHRKNISINDSNSIDIGAEIKKIILGKHAIPLKFIKYHFNS